MSLSVVVWLHRYIEKWKQGIGGGVDLHPIDGLWDSMTCKVSRADNVWDIEYIWMTGYFIGGVWISQQLEYMDEFMVGAKKVKKVKKVEKVKEATKAVRSRSKSRSRTTRSMSRSKKD